MDLKRLNPGMTAVTASGGGVLIYNLLSEYSPYILLFLKRSTCLARVKAFCYHRKTKWVIAILHLIKSSNMSIHYYR